VINHGSPSDGAGVRTLSKIRDDAQAASGAAAAINGAPPKPCPTTTAGAAATSRRVTRIAAASPWYETGLGELVKSRDLVRVFTWRLISVQYKQAVLGIAWAVLSPLLSTLVFSFVFGRLGGMPSDGFPYPVFVLSGLITWQFFARAISVGSVSIIVNSAIITKVWFPRMVLPLSAVLSGFVDYGVNLAVLLVAMMVYGFTPGPALAALPVFMLFAAMLGFALSLWLSALNALYRDIGLMIPIVLQAWMFMTPVIYPVGLVPPGWAWILQINPMTAVVEGARWAVLSAAPPDLQSLAILAGEIAMLFLGGIVTFNRIDAILADRI
jgi:lipopolysaccharide transport system permease protein